MLDEYLDEPRLILHVCLSIEGKETNEGCRQLLAYLKYRVPVMMDCTKSIS
jgi:hypothetical protein